MDLTIMALFGHCLSLPFDYLKVHRIAGSSTRHITKMYSGSGIAAARIMTVYGGSIFLSKQDIADGYDFLVASALVLLFSPLDHILTRVQLNPGNKILDVVKDLIGQRNRFIMRGMWCNYFRQLISTVPLKEISGISKHHNYDRGKALAMTAIPAIIFSFPFENVRTRLQCSTKYLGVKDCISRTISEEGVFGLYKGFFHYSCRNIAFISSCYLFSWYFQ